VTCLLATEWVIRKMAGGGKADMCWCCLTPRSNSQMGFVLMASRRLRLAGLPGTSSNFQWSTPVIVKWTQRLRKSR
jgi:hypothetical protein